MAIDYIRGMNNLPLDAKGLRETKQVADRLAKRGGVMGVSSSPLTRAIQTASEVLSKCPTARLLDVTSCLEPWHMGEFEGEPSAHVHVLIQAYVEDPTKKLPGIGSSSKVPGESLQDYLNRFLPYIDKAARTNPKGFGLIEVCHYRNIKALLAWVAAGAKKDWSIDPKVFLEKDNIAPASLWCVWEDGHWEVEPEDLYGEDGPLTEIYILRHSSTSLNGSPTRGSMAAGS